MPVAHRSTARVRRRPAFTLVEIVIVLLLACLVFGMLGTFVWRNARTSRATDRKLQAISAVHYLSGRLRRDVKGAASFAIDEGGKRLTLTDAAGRKRVYQYDPQERTLQVPDLVDPAASVRYELARFRKVEFTADPDGGGMTYVLSAVPFFETKETQLTETEVGWGSAIAGRITHLSSVQALQYPGANLRGLTQ